ncbi:ATP-dependent helicase [Pontibacillus sp. ALD_SL1]|uniref:UvrD-helicase domain-containing protein n=1 Tax=Pontibacillus sp. ALD_SL1 TaxID=2777185 RepID=UPI001A956C94|nr:UvrD-helicase domain-containing protein [Pontibacillus sp. ALD_SL1]QST00328.1 ATP-dependent helicase [Pontibacillus sp. ALD_SL1]
MSFKVITDENLQREKQIQEEINEKIDTNESMVFDSGAGAGKTYALTESLRHVIKRYGKRLSLQGQQIICITYTNIATEELKERLGYSDLVLVSTIHERIWGLIEKYQDELVEIHVCKLKENTNEIESEINSNKFKKYNELEDREKEKFINLMHQLKSEFYRCYDMKSAEYKQEFGPQMSEFDSLLHNVSTFRKLVLSIYKVEKYKKAIKKIEEGNPRYKKVQYTPRVNSDKLDEMQISHDTLLEYGNKMFERYFMLRRLIIDKYPYIFIDEYQDTNPLIVDIMNRIFQTANEIERPIFIGYYGDSAQNIYEDGVGNALLEIHPGLTRIVKEFNRRSSTEVIDVINNIRLDGIFQRSIYEDGNCGSVELYQGSRDNISVMIDKCKVDWAINEENNLHCLVLTNRMVAEQTGLWNFYNAVSKMPRYSVGKGYEQLNTELLSSDLSKLGYAQRAIYELVDNCVNINNQQSLISDLFPLKVLCEVNISQLREILSIMRSIEAETFGEYIDELVKIHDGFGFEKDLFRKVISNLFPDGKVSKESFLDVFRNSWSKKKSDEEIEQMRLLLDELLNVPMKELKNWHKLIGNNLNSEVNYYTYHGTKGLEFDNVLIVMENKFGRDPNFFGKFFEQYQQRQNLEGEDKIKYESVRNLLYVSCSRAIKNLRIYVVDDLASYGDVFRELFGDINHITD